MSYSHYPNFLNESELVFRRLIVEMLGCNENKSEQLFKRFTQNYSFINETLANTTNLDELEKKQILAKVYNKVVNSTLDHIALNEPKFFIEAEDKITSYFNKIIGQKINVIENNFYSSIVIKYHIHNQPLEKIADQLNIDRSSIQEVIYEQNEKLINSLKLKVGNKTIQYKTEALESLKNRFLDKVSSSKFFMDVDKYKEQFNMNKETIGFMIHELTCNTELSNKLLEESYYLGFIKLKDFNSNQTTFSAWIFSISINHAIESIRKLKMKKNDLVDTGQVLNEKLKIEKDIKIRSHYNNWTVEECSKLSKKYSNYLELKYFKKLSAIEISKLFCQSIYYIRAQIIKAEREALTQLHNRMLA